VGLTIEGVTGAPKSRWDSVVTHDQFMAPMFVAVAIGNALETTTAERGDMTWRSTTTIRVAGYGTLSYTDFGSSAGDTIGPDSLARSRAIRALGALLNNPWGEVRIEGVETKVNVSFDRDLALLRSTRLLEEELDPGQPARIELNLMPWQGKFERRVIEVPIPASFAGREVDIELAPGHEVERPRAAPESLDDLVAALRDPSFPEDSVVATIRLEGEGAAAFRGNVATRLPPRAIDALRVSASSMGPDTFGAVQHSTHPMQQFVLGRDRVRVRVRPPLR